MARFTFDHLITTRFNLLSADLNIKIGNPIRLELTGPDKAFHHSYEQGHLVVRQRADSYDDDQVVHMGLGNNRHYSIVFGSDNIPSANLWLPENYLASHSVYSAEGNISAEGVASRVTQVVTASGNVALRTMHVDALSVRTNQGNVEMQKIQSRTPVVIQTISGDVELYGSGAPDWDISTDSGDINLRQMGGKVNPRTVSGDIYY